MRISTGAGTALALWLASMVGGGAANAQEAPLPKRTMQLLNRISEAADSGDCRSLLRLGQKLPEAEGAEKLPGELTSALQTMMAECAFREDRPERGYALLLKATASSEADDSAWHMRLIHELQTENAEAAVATVEAMSQGRGAALNSFPAVMLMQFESDLERKEEDALRKRLLKVLASSAYDPIETLGETDVLKASYAQLLFDGGEEEEAAALVRSLRDPMQVAGASLDPRFRSLFGADPDIRRTTEANLERHRQLIGLHPDRLLPLTLAAEDLMRLGRAQEAVDLLETARSRLDDPQAFTDRDDQLPWWWNALAYAHSQLGNYDAMVDAFRKGATLDEFGGPNVSQALNLALQQAAFGRGADALKTLAPFDDPALGRSPYGEMILRKARACALAVEGRPEEAANDLAFARAHKDDGEAPYADLLLCLGRLDEAAALFIERLKDRDKRADALFALSDYDPPLHPLPHSTEAQIEKLKARADIQAAIAEAGGIRRFNIQR